MDIDGLFQTPSDHLVKFARIQSLLYREDPALQDYFMQLQMDMRTDTSGRSRGRERLAKMARFAMYRAERAISIRRNTRIKADILFCPLPYFGRKTENLFASRTLMALAETDATILCLMADNAPFRGELEARLQLMRRKNQVLFIDPMSLAGSIQARVRRQNVRLRSRSDFERAREILAPDALSPNLRVREGFEHVAGFVVAWEQLAPYLDFGAVVARCHWHTLCSPVCRTALQRGKQVVTFQQGVIGHSLDAPVTASKYVAFGQASSSFLEKMNRRFFSEPKIPETKVSFVNGGCLYDEICRLPDQFHRRTLLLVDVPVAQGDFYGIDSQCTALLRVADRLLGSVQELHRIIIRPHPYWNDLDFEACQRLARRYSERCEISHPSWSLGDDLRRSSVVMGVFSGVLTVASACGLPSIFIVTEEGYMTGDLKCFSPEQTLLPNEAFEELKRLLEDSTHYANARRIALRNGSEYYANGEDIDLNGAFFSRLLGEQPLTNEMTVSAR